MNYIGHVASTDKHEGGWRKVGKIPGAVEIVLIKASVVYVAFQAPNGRKHTLRFIQCKEV